MNEMRFVRESSEDACSRRIFAVVFRLTSIADLYGPAEAIEWAQSLLDDPGLLAAFARPHNRTTLGSQDEEEPALS